MSDVVDEVRETFRVVAGEVPVPVFDELRFRAEVRRTRRRRTGRLVGGVAVAASVSALALATVPPMLEDDTTPPPSVAGGKAVSLEPTALPAPLYFTAGGQMRAATPDGEVHDLGEFEAVVGSTAEGVLAVSTDSRPVWIASTTSGEGDGSYTFERDAGPVKLPETGPVQSVALSGDGRWLAWLDLRDVVSVYDLKARAKVQHIEVDPNAYVASVSDRGALVSVDGELVMFRPEGSLDVPTEGDGYGWVSDTAADFVSVVDRDDVTRIYDVGREGRDGVAPLVDSVSGTGRLAPYAAAIVSVDGSAVQVYADGAPATLTGLEGTPQSAGWLDEDHALVTTAESGGTAIYVCPIADTACARVAFSQDDIRLAE